MVDERNSGAAVCPPSGGISHTISDRLKYAVPVALVLALVPFYHMAWSAPGVGLSHDDGIYLATAKALATGKGYTIISLPVEIRQTKYPILFPLLLSFLWRIDGNFPQNVGVLKLLPLAATMLWLVGVYYLARELAVSRAWALNLTVCVAANPWVVSFSGSLRPENLFGALAMWTLVFLMRAERSGDWRPTIYGALLAAGAYHTRTAALAIIVGGVLGLCLKRRYSLSVVFGSICTVLCLPWMIWQGQQNVVPPVESYYTSLSYKQYNILTYFSKHEKLVILQQNLFDILISPCSLFGIPFSLPGLAMSVAFWLICIVGLVRLKSRCFALTSAASVLMSALWSWPPHRFLFPASGLLLLAACSAFRHRTTRLVAFTFLLFGVVSSLWSLRTDAQKSQLVLIEWKNYPATWPQMMNVQNWISVHASPGDVVLSSVDPFVYFYTGLKAIRGYYCDPLPAYYGLPSTVNAEQEFLRILYEYHPRYLLQMHPDFYENRFLGPTTAKLIGAGYIAEVHQAGALHVYEVLRIPSAQPL